MTAMVMTMMAGGRVRGLDDETAVPLLLRFLFWATRNNSR